MPIKVVSIWGPLHLRRVLSGWACQFSSCWPLACKSWNNDFSLKDSHIFHGSNVWLETGKLVMLLVIQCAAMNYCRLCSDCMNGPITWSACCMYQSFWDHGFVAQTFLQQHCRSIYFLKHRCAEANKLWAKSKSRETVRFFICSFNSRENPDVSLGCILTSNLWISLGYEIS